jgi:hypothetical protein
MPVCPVARKVDFGRAPSSPVHRQPGVHLADRTIGAHGQTPLAAARFTPLAIGYFTSGTRTSCSAAPWHGRRRPDPPHRAGGCAARWPGRSLPPAPEPAPSSTPAEITPPRFATPTTSVLAPAAFASVRGHIGRPRSALQPSIRNCPTALSGRQSRMPCATFAASGRARRPGNRRYGVSIIQIKRGDTCQSTPSLNTWMRGTRS